MRNANLVVDNPNHRTAHREACNDAQTHMDKYLAEVAERKLECGFKRPQPSGKYPPRMIGETTYMYLNYLSHIHKANDNLLTDVINDLTEKLQKIDLDAIDRKLSSFHLETRDARDDMHKATKTMAAEVRKAVGIAEEAMEALKDAHARLDDVDELLDEYFE